MSCHPVCSLHPAPVQLQDAPLKQTQVVRVHCWPMVVLLPAIPNVLPPPLLHSVNCAITVVSATAMSGEPDRKRLQCNK